MTPDDATGEGRMYVRPGKPAVSSVILKYMNKLHPNLDDLWQRPRDSFDESKNIWYCKVPLGKIKHVLYDGFNFKIKQAFQNIYQP